MKPPSQFLPLFRIELARQPGLWIFLASFCVLHVCGLYIFYWLGMDMDLWLANHGAGFEDGFTLLAILYAGMFLFPGPHQQHVSPNPPEFMLTRALDRKTYFSAKECVFLLLVLFPVLIHGIFALLEPNMILATRNPEMSEQGQIFLSHFSGVRAEPGDGDFLQRFTVPDGRLVYAGWKFWSGLLLAALTLGATTLLQPFQKKFSFAPKLQPVAATLPFFVLLLIGNALFDAYLGKPVLITTMILLIITIVHRFCRREFERMEVL